MTTSRLLASAAVAALAAASPLRATEIGAVAAVNSEVIGEPPQVDPRDLILGDRLVLNERVESSPIGTGQFLFLDQSALTVAPNSNIVLDRYVYDPATQTGEFALSMTRGVLRFVGGRISKTTDAVITTPTATIGIRGGISIIIVEEDGTTRVMHIAGEYTKLTSLTGEEIIISRSNGVGEVSINGVITYLGVADQVLIRETTVALLGRGEAGQRVRPEEPDVIESGVPSVNSEAKGAATDDPVSTSGEAESDFGDEERQTERTDEEITTATAPTPDNPTPPPPPPGPVLILGATGSASFAGGTVPGLTSGGAGAEDFTLTQIFEGSRIGVTAEGETFIIPTPNRTGFFDFDAGDGSASPRGALNGRGFFNRSNEFTYAVFQTAQGRNGAFLSGIVSPALPAAGADTTVARRYTISDDLGSGAGAAFTNRGAAFGGDGRDDLILIGDSGGAATGGNAKVLYTYLDINGAGASQTSGFGVLTGNVTASGKGNPDFEALFEGSFSGGAGAPARVSTSVAPVSDGAGGTAFGPGARFMALTSFANGSGEPGRAFDAAQNPTLFGTNNVADRNAVETVAAADRAPINAFQGGFSAISGFDLTTGESYSGRSADNDGISLRLDPASNGGSAVIRLDDIFGGDPQNGPALFALRAEFGRETKAATLDDRRFAMRDATPNEDIEVAPFANFADVEFSGALASADLVGNGGIFAAGTDTTPEHLTWGWWAGELRAVPNQTCQECDPLETDQRLHLGAWIAGDVTANAAIPTSGVATFDGHAVISAIDNGRSIVDGARFDMVFDFAEEVGTTTFTGLLGANTTVAVGRGDFGGFEGVGGITVGGRDGVIGVNGDFFNDRAGNPAAAAAGSLGVRTNDGTLTGAGVFGGDRRTFTGGVNQGG